ncbi:MAG: arylsulfatase [Planctomycetaceae bacterium]|nr:arylsulfatase [Planctomycetaceae bacterium]
MYRISSKWLYAFCVVWVFGLIGAAHAEAPPNIIVVYTDDMGFGDVSCLNPEAKFRTPNIDRLAAEGIALTNAHCADTVCTPSRYGLLTGRYCWRTDRKTGVMGAEGKCLITNERMTLASLLQQQGYQTAMVGKWHLGMDFPGDPGSRDWSQPVQDMPLDKGFEYFFGVPASLNYGVLAWFEGRHAKVPPTLYTAKKPNERYVDYRIKPPYEATPEETKQVLGKVGMEVAPDFVDNECLTRFTDKAISWMQQATNSDEAKPFFLYLPYTSPHYPVCPRPEFWGQGECGGYGEFVVETDYHVGRILKFLDEANLAENTLIVFTSDNGPENSWKQRIEEFNHYSSGPYRGGKRDIYEGGHRVPFLVRWPARIPAPGRRHDNLIGQVDLLATFADVTSAILPDDVGEDSQSFAGLLFDEKFQHERLPTVSHGANGRFAITSGTWKLVMPQRKLPYELYDLENDPAETQNLAASEPQRVKELENQLTRIVCRGRTTQGSVQQNDTGYWSDLSWLTPESYAAAAK